MRQIPNFEAMDNPRPSDTPAPRSLLLFDIDGVIRDVGGSYRRAIVETVNHYSGWRPESATIDSLKAEGCWNNDWKASLELLRRRGIGQQHQASLPAFEDLVEIFNSFYFGGDPEGDPSSWRGFIRDEPLLVNPEFFETLDQKGCRWGFVSGAEPPSARFVLETRLGLVHPPLIAMGDAPDKPDPEGLIRMASTLVGSSLGSDAPLIAYLGDTVADVKTVTRAREQVPQQRWMSLAVVPPHLQSPEQSEARAHYEANLRAAGAEVIFPDTQAALNWDPNQI